MPKTIAHLIHCFFFNRNSKSNEQEALLKLLWRIWPMLSAYGCKAAQFVDLLGYFSLRMIQKSESAKQVSSLDNI